MGHVLNEKVDHVLANMEQLGAQTVRDLISSGLWPANYDALAKEWLHQKDIEEADPKEAQVRSDARERGRKDADDKAQMLLVRRSNEIALSAREASVDANRRAEDEKRAQDAHKHAEEADKRAEGANLIARNAKNIAFTAANMVEQSAGTARTAKRIAIVALAAALIAIAIPIAALFIRWPPALQTLVNIMWQR